MTRHRPHASPNDPPASERRPRARPGPPSSLAATTQAPPCAAELDWSGFYRLPLAQRSQRVARVAALTAAQQQLLERGPGLELEQADQLIENAVGVAGLPLGVCVHLRVDGRDRIAPMAIEEPSVIAAASHAAKLLRAGEGIRCQVSPSHMIGQVQLLEVAELDRAEAAVDAARGELIARANACDPTLIACGGGAVDLEIRHLPQLDPEDPVGPMMVVHLVVDVRDAMGANTVNTMCEQLAPRLAELAGGRARLRIVSNLADRRTVLAEGTVPLAALQHKGCGSAESLARGIVEASVFAERDPYRATTHNKGIMNGVDAVLVACGQDWRAVEAGAHAFAARDGRYTALARWRLRDDGLHGRLELPMPVGVVGGATAVHPTSQVALGLGGVQGAADLARLAAAVGLAQNLGALRALAAEGIQRGHMRVHARNVALAAGALGGEIDRVARDISSSPGRVTLAGATEALRTRRGEATRRWSTAHVRERFAALRHRHVGDIEALLDTVVQHTTGAQSSLHQMSEYHLQTGGKRLRALLPLLVAEALGADPAPLLPFGAACEMLHNATLVHDDLQDGDLFRRGQETVWHRYGAARAINLGDGMFYYALLLLERLTMPPVRRQTAATQMLRETVRVIEGQEREFLLKEHAQPSLDDYVAMVERKTSGLFALPVAGAATLCGAGSSLVEPLREATGHLGVLFQIQDDLLDLYGDKGREERGSDIREGKRSILVVHGLAHASAARAQWLRRVLDQPREETSQQEVDEVIELLSDIGSLQFALRQIADRRRAAAEAIAAAEHPTLALLCDGIAAIFLEPIGALAAAQERSGRADALARTGRVLS